MLLLGFSKPLSFCQWCSLLMPMRIVILEELPITSAEEPLNQEWIHRQIPAANIPSPLIFYLAGKTHKSLRRNCLIIFPWSFGWFLLEDYPDLCWWLRETCVLCIQAEARLRAHEITSITTLNKEKHCNKWDLRLSTSWFISRMKGDVWPLYLHLMPFITKAAVSYVHSCHILF